MVTQGFHTGIFVNWASVMRAIGHEFYIEEKIPVDVIQANFIMESQAHEEEVTRLSKKNEELTEELTQLYEKQEEIKQVAMELSENQLKSERRKKKGIPHVNRSFECLSVRLKMPQFTCITLQPLFEACPELEVIIAEKAKTVFYQKIIQLQNFLISCHINHWYKGVTITQEYFYYKEQPTGFLKAQINMAHCTMPRE